jgi:hypothetical protein
MIFWKRKNNFSNFAKTIAENNPNKPPTSKGGVSLKGIILNKVYFFTF